jgi:uncharacterized protein involved in exopolysaccharide biosynthesis
MALTAIYNYKMPPIYRATVSIEVATEYPQLQSINDLYRQNPEGEDSAFLATQIQVLRSDNLAWQTIEQLGLNNSFQAAPSGDGSKRSAAQVAAARKAMIIEGSRHCITNCQ